MKLSIQKITKDYDGKRYSYLLLDGERIAGSEDVYGLLPAILRTYDHNISCVKEFIIDTNVRRLLNKIGKIAAKLN